MKLATFTQAGRTRIGRIDGDRVIDLTAAGLPGDMITLLEGGAELMTRAASAAGTRYALADITLRAPVLRPPKILAFGLNY